MFNNQILDYSKTRIRTSEELESRRKNFLEICQILDELNVFYFIHGGTLLGARRDKKFIEWDWDVEISFYNNDFQNIFDDLLKKLLIRNFSIFQSNKCQNPKIDCYKDFDYKTSTFTLSSWSYDKNKKRYFRGKINVPEKFLKKNGNIEFYGKIFNTPSPLDEYLTYQYGDWKTRKRTSDKRSYMTSQYYKGDSLFIRLLKFFFHIIKKPI